MQWPALASHFDLNVASRGLYHLDCANITILREGVSGSSLLVSLSKYWLQQHFQYPVSRIGSTGGHEVRSHVNLGTGVTYSGRTMVMLCNVLLDNCSRVNCMRFWTHEVQCFGGRIA